MSQTLKTQVLIVGAGASGIPAAIGAARAGARVILLEEDTVIGGAMVDYGVDMLCGGPVTGVMKEAQDLLRARYSPTPDAYFFLPDSFQRVFWQLLNAEPNIQVINGARVVETLVEAERAVGVRAETGLGRSLTVRAQVVVDATGTGAVSILAGCTAMYGRDAQRDFDEPHAPPARDLDVQECTWMYISQKLGGGPEFDMMKLDNVRLGVLVNGLGWFHQDPQRAMRLKRGIYLHWGCRVRCTDTRDTVELGKAQAEALQLMERDHALLREAGYRVYLAPRLGVRESNRIRGEHVIDENDLRAGVLPADTIAVGTYGIDIWGEYQGIKIEDRVTPAYGIPYRALVPSGVDNLLLAGRCISGSHLAMSAYRVMPIAASIGQASGVAAALCAGRGTSPRALNAQDVQDVLRAQHMQIDFGRSEVQRP
jgi:hypothetical protein